MSDSFVFLFSCYLVHVIHVVWSIHVVLYPLALHRCIPQASKHKSPRDPNNTCFDDFNTLCMNEADMTNPLMNDSATLIQNLYMIFRKLPDAGFLRYFIFVVKVVCGSL